MDDSIEQIEGKFTKSTTNRRTENVGLSILLSDQRFQALPSPLKKEVAQRLGIFNDFKTAAFDAVMTPTRVDPIDSFNLDAHIDSLRLVEMKTTRRAIKDAGLADFFGATDREYRLARLLGGLIPLRLRGAQHGECLWSGVLRPPDPGRVGESNPSEADPISGEFEPSPRRSSVQVWVGPLAGPVTRAAESNAPYG